VRTPQVVVTLAPVLERIDDVPVFGKAAAQQSPQGTVVFDD
jgi:hypothetical protein